MNSEQVCIIFIGLDISKEVFSVNSSRIQVMKVWPVPKSVHSYYYSEKVSLQLAEFKFNLFEISATN